MLGAGGAAGGTCSIPAPRGLCSAPQRALPVAPTPPTACWLRDVYAAEDSETC